jgi:hypothetical protein
MAEKWEYDVQPIQGDTAKIKATLDQMGNVGWELIQIVGQNYFFKREKEEGRERPGSTQYKREVPQKGHPVG